MARCFPENRSGRLRVCGHWMSVIQLAVLTAYLLVVSEANVASLHLTLATRYFHNAGSQSYDIRVACYQSSPDTDADLSYGRVPVPLPGAGIESATSFPDDTITEEYNEQEFKQLPRNANATGLYYCEGTKGDQTTRVYSSTFRNNSWFYPGSRYELQLTKTINKGENANLTVQTNYGNTNYAQWRRIRDGIVTHLTDYDGMDTLTIPASQAKHGDVYAVVDSRHLLSDNQFTLIRLIVRGCTAGKWGPPACDGVCDLCYHGGVCDDKTGDCICPPGFSGPNCLTICPYDSFGLDCEFSCRGLIFGACFYVQFGLPDPFGITCISGLQGTGCNYGCPLGQFGAGCSEECHCRSAIFGCDRRTGVCDDGDCAAGWSGSSCQIPDVCPVGYYGLNCLSKCHCYSNAACDKYTGYCSAGCAAGFTCVTWQCDPGYFGENCSKECLCLDGAACDGITGTCQSPECPEEYQSDGTGICQFVLPVLSQPPEVTVQSTSAIVSWKAWGSHLMDAGDGPIIGYKVYSSDPLTSSWIEIEDIDISETYQSSNSFRLKVTRLQYLEVYNFSVSAVREGDGGEGPRSPLTTIETQAEESATPPTTSPTTPPTTSCFTGLVIGLVVAVSVIAVILVALAVDYLHFRMFSRRRKSKNQPMEGALNMAGYENSLAKDKPQRMSVIVQGYENVCNDERGTSNTVYEDVAKPWTEHLTVPFDRLSVGYKVLGTGHFGEVRMATLMLEDGQAKAAVKQLIKSNSSAGARQMFIEEYRTLADIGTHQNIINILAVCFDGEDMYVALEYQPNGDLRSYLRKARSQVDDSSSSLSAVKLLQMAADVVKGMQHVAASGVIHRKLAARSVLLDANLVAKVSGFGQARCGETVVEKSKVSIPPRWLSLESLKTNTYTSKSDIWSFGILLWEIGSLGATPYSGIKSASLETRLENGYRIPKPDNCDGEIYKLMAQCWQEDPKNRPPFKKLASVLDTMARSNKQQMLPKAESHRYMNIRPDQDDN